MSDLVSDPLEMVFGKSIVGAELIYSEARRDILRAIESSFEPFDTDRMIRSTTAVLNRMSPLMIDHLTDTDMAGFVTGMNDLSKQFPAWLWREFTTGIRTFQTPPPLPPNYFRLMDMFDPEPRLRFPLIEKAAERLSQRNVLTRDQWEAASIDARERAFFITGDVTTDTIAKVRDVIVNDISEGASFKEFRKKIGDTLEKSGIGPARVENIYRTNVQAAFRDGRETLITDPIVTELFPYQQYIAIHDKRARQTHKDLEKFGLSGTNIYRRDDPFWDRFTPPWDYQCRCGVRPMTVDAAARAGVEEARQWLKTGVPPEKPEWQDSFIPFPHNPNFGTRGRVVIAA